MKVWTYKVFSVLLSALVVLASADTAFAGPKKLPKLKSIKAVTPKTVLPKTPKGPVKKPHTAVPVNRVVTQKAVKAPQVASVNAQVEAVTPAVQDSGTNLTGTQVLAQYFPTWRKELGGKFSNEQLDAVEKAFADTDDWMFVRGEDGELKARNKDEWNYEARFLSILQNSGVSFTDRQIKQLIGGNAIRGFTFKIYFFRMKATGFSCAKGTKPRPHIYRDGRRISNEEMTPEEEQEVYIGHGLNKHRNHPIVQAYLQGNRLRAENKTPEEYVALARQYPTKPRMAIFKNGNILSREEMTPEELQEVNIGIGLSTYRNHPLVQTYMQENRLRAENKTPEEYVALARQYPTKPRASISRGGHKIPRAEMTPEEVQEVNIGKGLNTHRNHPLVQAYMQENRLRTENKTPEEYVALAQQYPTKPRAQIYRNGILLSREEMTPEEEQEVNIGRGLGTHRNHPLVQAYMQENRLRAEAQTTQQLYTTLATHVKEYEHYPTKKESSLYINIYNRLRRYQSTMVDGKYADPWLQKIYELKTAVQNAPEGKFTLTPDGQGGYLLETEQPAVEDDVTAPQKVEELAPVVPSPHIIRQTVDEKTKNLIESVRDAAALERREFYPWLMSMRTPDKSPQIVNKNTWDALFTLSRAINFDYKARQNRRAVTYLLETVNNYVGILGEQDGIYYKLIYRGQPDANMLPTADNFHVVAEEQGMSWDGELAPQVEKVNRLHMRAVKENTPYSVYLDGDEERVTALGIEPKVPAKTVGEDLQTTLKYLLPPGYTVRMGLHELGIVGKDLTKFRQGYLHIHLENTAPSEFDEGPQIDHSISLDIKAGRFAGWWDPKVKKFYPYSDAKIAENYRTLFDSFLDEEAKEKLDILSL